MNLLTKISQVENLGEEVSHALESSLVVHVQNFRSLDSSFWYSVASEIGTPCVMDEDRTSGDKTGSFWIDVKYDPDYPQHFIHANVRQPFHTDGSYESQAPNITFFYCIKEADFGGATTFLDCSTIQECLQREQPKLLEELRRTKIKFSKGSDSKQIEVFHHDCCNWNWFRSDKSKLASDFHAFLEERIWPMGLAHSIKLQAGEALFFRDDRILHGRNAFMGARWLKKGGIKWIPKS